MRAIVVSQFGDASQLRLEEVPDPLPGPGEVVIDIAAAGVNRADILTRSGKYHRAGQPPLILGSEAAGAVTAVGPDVTSVAPGQRVLAWGAANQPGFYAERAAVAASSVVPVPDRVSLREAAVLPTAWLSAWYCLHRLVSCDPANPSSFTPPRAGSAAQRCRSPLPPGPGSSPPPDA